MYNLTEITSPDQATDPKSVLIVPVGVKHSEDFPFEIYGPGWSSIVSIFDNMTFPVVLEIEADHVETFLGICGFHDVELKTLRGLEGDYPSYWLISTSKFPMVNAPELMLLGKEAASLEGSGVDQKKVPKDEFDQPDPRINENILLAQKSYWDTPIDQEVVE